MSALGQKQTLGRVAMSALPPKSGHSQCTRPRLLWDKSGHGRASFGHQTVRLDTAQVANASFESAYQQPLCLHCPQPIRGACCCSMIDDSHQHAENAEAILKVAYCRDGVDVAVQA